MLHSLGGLGARTLAAARDQGWDYPEKNWVLGMDYCPDVSVLLLS
jgi:hypothetical protein